MDASSPVSPTPRPAQPTTVVLQGPVRVVVDQSSGRWFRIIRWAFWAFIIVAVLSRFSEQNSASDSSNTLTQKHHSLVKGAPSRIAIVHVEGVIASSDGFV